MKTFTDIPEKNNGDKLAFPSDGQYTGECRCRNDAGLTKREYFAGLAMQGLLSREDVDAGVNKDAVWFADHLLSELEKPQP